MPGLNQLVDTIRAKYPGAYDDMDDASLTKSVLAKYPQYSDLAAPGLGSVKPPAPPSELAPEGFMGKVGNRIEQNVYAIPNALSGITAQYQEGLTTPKAKAEASAEQQQQIAGTRQMITGGAKSTLGKAGMAATLGPR